MTNFKQKLMLGTALVAVGAFSGAAFAADEFLVDGNNSGTFTAAAPDETADTALDWDAGSNGAGTAVANHDLRVDNDGTINFSADATVGDATTTTAGIQAGVTGKTLTITNNNGAGNARTATVTGDISVGSLAALSLVIAGSVNDGDALTVDVNGDVNLGTGTISLTGNDNGSDGNLNISGNLTSGAVTLNAAAGAATLTFDGSTAQVVSSSNILGGGAGEGDIVVNNTAGVTFTGTIGATTTVDQVKVGTTNANSAATFKAAVSTANGIVIGDGANANTHTVTFDGTTAGYTVAGVVDGDGAANDTAQVVVQGGKTISFTDNVGTNNALDAFTVSGTGTKADMNGDLTSVLVTVGSGATLDLDDNLTSTGGITLGGTLQVTGTSNIDGNINGSAAGTGVLDIDAAATVKDNVGLTTSISSVDVASGITLTLDPDGATATYATANGINLNDDGTDNGTNTILAFTTADGNVITVNSAITTTTNKEGQITISDSTGTVDFNGNVGTSTKALQSVTFGANTNNVVTAAGNWYVDDTILDGNDVLRFDGTSAQVVGGTIHGAAADDGHLIVGNTGTKSSVTFNGSVGVTNAAGAATNTIEDFTVVSGSTAIFGGTAGTTTHRFSDDLVIDGTLRINQGISVRAQDYVAGAATGSAEFVVGTTNAGVDQAGRLVLDTQVNWDNFDGTTANTTKALLKQGTGVILNGQDFFIVDGAVGDVQSLAAGGETVADEYALFNFKAYMGATAGKTVGGSTNQDVVVEATHVRGEEVTGNRNNSEAADGILGVTVAQYARDNADGRNELALVYDHVTRATNAQVDERLEALQSTVDGGNIVAATSVANITSNIIQLASTDAEGSGIAAGNISNGLRAWAQVFGQTGEQDNRDSVDGYDIDTYGFAVGLDTQALADQMVLGLAFSYADSDVDSDNANRTKTEIDTYQITLYGTYDLDEATYISGQLGYAFGDNSTHREDIGGVAAIDADGDFDSNQFIARLEAGRAYEVGAITTLTPKLLVNYNYYDADSYRETGAGGAGLNVDQDTNHILEIGAGVDADWMFQQADGSYVKPQVRAGVRYDLADDEIEATNRLIGGGNAFKTEGFDPQQFALDLGAGVTYFSTTNWELTANYDFEYKEDYNSHAGFLRAAYKF